MKNGQIIGLLVVVGLVVAGIAYLQSGKVAPGASNLPAVDVSAAANPIATSTAPATAPSAQAMSAADRIAAKAAQYDRAKEIAAPSGFVNTGGKPITLSQYIGKKVILLDIMTYSCINCVRTFPYLNDWYTKYEDKGLIIIGIHTPEFDFEKNIDNVKAAMAKYGIKFPVVLDNDYGTWSAYKNLYWPRKYLIDIDGFIRYDHIGEGGYDETEAKIQELLKERADVLALGAAAKAAIDMPTSTGSVEQGQIGETPETYIGSARRDSSNPLVLNGDWNVQPEYAENTSVPASIVYPITAKNVYLVASADNPVAVDVVIDGKLSKTITVGQSQIYDIYAGDSFGSHTVEIKPQSKGLKAFTFTFGS